MEELIPTLYRNYGTYVNTNKMFPSMEDGLIPVWRRILLGAYTVARKEFVKSATVFGYVIGHWHPHSEAIQGTAEILVHNGFLDGKGNWGTSIGVEPIGCAAPRYTSLKLNKDIEKLAFEYIKDVEWIDGELDPEPRVLPAMIPICLFNQNEMSMIGFGYRTDIPNYTLPDLIKRLMYLIGERKRKVTISPNIPGCDIISGNDVVENLLSVSGKHTINIVGRYKEDRRNYRIIISGWTPRYNFKNLFNRIDAYEDSNMLSKNDVVYIDESNDKVGTRIVFEVARARNRDKFYDLLLGAIQSNLVSNITYNIIAVDPNGKVVETSVDEMLLAAYSNYISTLRTHFTKRVNEISELMMELKYIKMIKPHLHKVYSLKDVDEMIDKLSSLSKVPVNIVNEILNKYRIKKLMTIDTDISKLKDEKTECEKNLKNLDKYAVNEYATILKSL
jgi:DNA gyrase/topoisomerase IV subunit A